MTARRLWLGLVACLGASAVVGTAMEGIAPKTGGRVAAIGKASLASPFPKVFCKVGDEEPFGFEHVVQISRSDGSVVEVRLDRARLVQVEGPYARRNAYGAALAFASRLRPETTRAVVRHGLCGDAPLLLPDERGAEPPVGVTVRSSPRGVLGTARTLEVSCRD